jgi:ribonuclease-3
LFERFPDENEGFLTRMRTKLVNGKMLAHLSKHVGLNEFIIISHQIEENNGRNILNILEDAFEAFLAAIFQDLGFQAAHDWVLNVIETHLDFAELIRTNNNFKDQVFKYFQHNHGYLPRFYEMNVDTLNNQKVFKVCLKDQQGNILGTGKGNNKKEAENDAALQVLKRYCVELT